jgi:hypothetical protein
VRVARFLLVAAILCPLTTFAQDLSPFKSGRTRVSVQGGIGTSGSKTYGIVGLGAGYFLFDGFEVGVDGEAWLANPRHYKVTPAARYILMLPQFQPYVGAFYRRTFYEDREGLDSIGGRAGLVLPMGGRVYATAGIAYERELDCDEGLTLRCDQVYPEAGVSFSF